MENTAIKASATDPKLDKDAMINALAALAQETRLDIYRMLVEEGPKGLAVGEIGERLDVAGATLNHHLSQLKQSGLVTCKREGRHLIHAANYAHMDLLIDFLTDNCCQGEGKACTPKMLKTE